MDFFRAMEDGAGEDLGWFWKAWFYELWRLDQSVKDVDYVEQDPAKGAVITIENLDKMAMPAVLEVELTSGEKERFTFPVEIWQRGATWTFRTSTKLPIKSVVIDPDHSFPDMDSKNNTWKPLSVRSK
jgi:hypothetical protein